MNLSQCCMRVANLLQVPLGLYDHSGRLVQQNQGYAPLRDQALLGRLLRAGREDFPALCWENESILYGVLRFPDGQCAMFGPVCPVNDGAESLRKPGENLPGIRLKTFCEGLLLLDDLCWGHGLDYETLLSLNTSGWPAGWEIRQADSLLMARCKTEIQRRLYEKITVKALAEVLDVSSAYLSRVFHAEQGVTITDYVAQEKIRQAQRMLRFTDYSYEAIAYELGFSSQSYFGAVFKKLSGMTPKEYRQQNRSAF